MNEQWKPNKELIDWAKGHFSQMSVGGVWMPEGSGLTYVKEGDNKWRLQSMLDSDEVRENHNRMKILMWDVGISVTDDEATILPVPATSEEAYLQEVTNKREIAKSWADKDGTLLLDMGLENVFPKFIEDREVLLDNGETTTIEVWGYSVTNPNTGEEIVIDPDDYHLLMGDQYFMRFICKTGWIAHERGERGEHYENLQGAISATPNTYARALTRQEMVEYIDDGKQNISGVGSKIFGEEKTVPPWMWGTFCEFVELDEEE